MDYGSEEDGTLQQGQPVQINIDPEAFAFNVQKRYLFLHVNQMIQLCYPSVAFNNQRLTQRELPLLINCVNKLNTGVEYVQQVADSLLEGGQ